MGIQRTSSFHLQTPVRTLVGVPPNGGASIISDTLWLDEESDTGGGESSVSSSEEDLAGDPGLQDEEVSEGGHIKERVPGVEEEGAEGEEQVGGEWREEAGEWRQEGGQHDDIQEEGSVKEMATTEASGMGSFRDDDDRVVIRRRRRRLERRQKSNKMRGGRGQPLRRNVTTASPGGQPTRPPTPPISSRNIEIIKNRRRPTEHRQKTLPSRVSGRQERVVHTQSGRTDLSVDKPTSSTFAGNKGSGHQTQNRKTVAPSGETTNRVLANPIRFTETTLTYSGDRDTLIVSPDTGTSGQNSLNVSIQTIPTLKFKGIM